MKTLSPYRRTLALDREIATRQAEKTRISKAADLDRAVRGLRACARRGVTFDFDHVNEVCVSGKLIGMNGYDISKLFDWKEYHAYITCESDGLAFSIRTDDGVVTIHISFKERCTADDTLAAKLTVARRFLARHGVKMTADAIKVKRAEKSRELIEMDILIGTVEG